MIFLPVFVEIDKYVKFSPNVESSWENPLKFNMRL